MANTNTKNNKPGKERTQLIIADSDKLEFSGTTECDYFSDITLGKIVNTVFQSVFKDYVGCRITPDTADWNCPVKVELTFASGSINPKCIDGDGYTAFIPTTQAYANGSPSNSIVARTCAHNRSMSQLTATTITKEAADILYDYLKNAEQYRVSQPSAQSFSRAGLVGETTVSERYGQSIVYSVVTGIDINKVFSMLYIENDDKKHSFNVVPIRPITVMQSPTGQIDMNNVKWLYQVTLIDIQKLEDLYNECGYYNKTRSLNIVTESF